MALPIAILIFLFIFLMLYGANLVVVGLHHLIKRGEGKIFALSAVILAVATSFPELSLAITSGLSGKGALSLGNVLGANIANLTMVVGGAGIVAGRVKVHGIFFKREIFIALVAGFLPVLLMFDGILSRIDGVILIFLWALYVIHFFKIRFTQIAQKLLEDGSWHRFLHDIHVSGHTGLEWLRLLLGIVLLLASAQIIVSLATLLAEDSRIGIFLVGALVVALGTTLPELAFSIRSLTDREPTMFLGNILGSIIANSTLIVGIAAFISPIEAEISKVFLFGGSFLLIYLLFWFFIRTKHRLDRWEAGVLLGVYVAFILLVTH